jgi:hypothetical protein
MFITWTIDNQSEKRYPYAGSQTCPKEDAFLMFCFYGARPELWERKWQLGNPVLVN